MRRHPTTNNVTPGNGSPRAKSSPNRGSNLLGVSQYNERLVLQLIRRAGSLSKAEIARMTSLSAQTVTVIINRLLNDKLLRKQSRQREKGKVGQPAVPIALNPKAAYSIGIKIGRRSLDSMLIDFSGNVLRRFSHQYDYPDPDVIFPAIEQDIAALMDKLNNKQRARMAGIGIAAPYALSGWQQTINAPDNLLTRWNDIDIRQKVSENQDLPVWFLNDATAACIAELEFGNQLKLDHFLYFFIGTFIGGGIVLNGTLYTGAFKNAGAVGPMPVPGRFAGKRVNGTEPTVQLIHCASRFILDDRLRLADLRVDETMTCLERGNPLTADGEEIVETWLQQAAAAIAFAATSAISVIDFEGIVIDGALPGILTERLKTVIEHALAQMNLEGLVRPQVVAGTIGNDARALGGAMLPFYSNFAADRDVLLKPERSELGTAAKA